MGCNQFIYIVRTQEEKFPSPSGAWVVTPPLLYPETMQVVKAQSANLIKIPPSFALAFSKNTAPSQARCAVRTSRKTAVCLGFAQRLFCVRETAFLISISRRMHFPNSFADVFPSRLCRMIYGGLPCSKPAFHCGSFLQRAFQFVHSPDKKWAFFPSWGTNFPVYIKYFICS